SVGEVLDVMEQLVSAVEHAHSRQVIHRDIKPQNVIVRNDGTVKLTDFGIAIAQNAAQLTQTNSIMGSVHYLAPELAKGQAATVQSDIYALGIVMFELLSGKVPFAGDSAVNIALMHMEERMPSIRAIVGPDVNQAMENIIIKSTAKNKQYRYASAHEMLLDLVNCQYRDDEAVYEIEDDFEEDDSDNKTIVMDKDDINGKQKKKKKLSRNKKIMIAIAAVVAIAAITVGAIFMKDKLAMSGINMPDLIELKQKEAEEKLKDEGITEDKGFKINFEEEESEDVAKGKVISTDPTGGVELKKDATVTVKISTGMKVKIPTDLVGKSESDAKRILSDAGLKAGDTKYVEDNNVEAYTVKSYSPSTSEPVDKGTVVTLTVAIPEEISVNNVIGLSYGSALSSLEGQGFNVDGGNCNEDGKVIYQSKKSGSKAKKGAKIKLKCEIIKDPNIKPPTDNKTDARPE
ncbi:MAG: PASTA domain-containing protein, partial [Erysipelotrichales bacterium]